MDKIKLRLCAGTMCYVMGGAQLMEIEELLSEEEKQGIEIINSDFNALFYSMPDSVKCIRFSNNAVCDVFA